MKWIVVILFFCFPKIIDDHDIHLSVCDITVIDNNSLEIKLKIFYDDLQTSMNLKPGEELPKNYKGADDLINKFIQKNFSVFINEKKVNLIYLKSESATPAIWTTLKIDYVMAEISQIKIQNSIMTSLFDDQVNLVNVDINNHKETYKLDSKKKSIEIQIKKT